MPVMAIQEAACLTRFVPAEAIHLSALADTRAVVGAGIERLLRVHWRDARIGALLVDLPYWENFPRELVKYVLRVPPTRSEWGDRFHSERPARVGLELLMRARTDSQKAMALGYLSHAAVDRAIHPLVNSLARPRAVRLGRLEAQEHREVEKYQSVLFHERRFGLDFMGTRPLYHYIDIDPGALDEPFMSGSVAAALGEAPAAGSWRRWAIGYRQYANFLASPFGKLPARPHDKARERAALYDDVQFEAWYARAVERSISDVTLGFSLLEKRDFDRYDIEEGSIDDPPQPRPAASYTRPQRIPRSETRT
jgi:hypothetical protein